MRPDRLRWELAPPDDVTFFVGPEGLAYRSAHGQGEHRPRARGIAGALDDLRTLLGGDLAKLRDRWDLRLASRRRHGRRAEATPRPVPRPLCEASASLSHRTSFAPRARFLVEGPRDSTLIDFGALAVNAPVDPAKMRLPS